VNGENYRSTFESRSGKGESERKEREKGLKGDRGWVGLDVNVMSELRRGKTDGSSLSQRAQLLCLRLPLHNHFFIPFTLSLFYYYNYYHWKSLKVN